MQANYRWLREKKKIKEQKEYRERQTRAPGAKDNKPNKVWAYILEACVYSPFAVNPCQQALVR